MYSKKNHSKSKISNSPVVVNDKKYLYYKKTLPFFGGEAVYVYSFKENRMLFTSGWFDLLGYEDDKIGLATIVNLTTKRYIDFVNDLNEKALQFLSTKTEDLCKYSFTMETEKVHKNGSVIPLFSRIGVFKAKNGIVEEVIGIFQVAKSLKYGKIMQFSAYGPDTSEFEETLSKKLFRHFVISRKEKEALQLAAEGFAFKEIAHQLNVSQSAIEKRIIPLYKRFNVNSLPHLINFAHTNHIL